MNNPDTCRDCRFSHRCPAKTDVAVKVVNAIINGEVYECPIKEVKDVYERGVKING